MATKKSEFEERKALIEIQKKFDLDKHKRRMQELEFMRESDRLHHEREMERERIKSVEIRKMQDRKEAQRYYGN